MTSDPPANDNVANLAERLEQGELVYFPACPFDLPHGEEREFLFAQRLRNPHDAAIRFDPQGGYVRGERFTTAEDAERLARLMRSFSDVATGWLSDQLPEYVGRWVRNGATLWTEEEAIRTFQYSARPDLLHIDGFRTRPATGRRILRLYVNINPTEPRVWITSEKFDALLARYQAVHRLPARTLEEWCEPLPSLQRLLQRDWSGRPAYDAFILSLQEFLRSDEDFQERAARHFWHFPPGSAWLLFADGLSHAVLRGQFALEHSFFVPADALVQPEHSPLLQLVQAGNGNYLKRAG